MRSLGRAGIFGSDVPDHLEVAGHVVQNLGDVLAKRGHALAAIGAGAGAVGGELMHDILARQMLRQRLALRLAAFADGCRWLGGFSLGFDLGGLFRRASFRGL